MKQIKGTSAFGGIGGIGLISDTEQCKQSNFYLGGTKKPNVQAYYLDGNASIYDAKNGYSKGVREGATWITNDTITVIVDCDNWTLQYYKNNVSIADKLSIKPNMTYHAAYTAWGWYHLLTMYFF